MKSRITIEVDFENNNTPVIQILRKNSDDTRDSLISYFLQSLGEGANLDIRCVADYRPNHIWDDEAVQRWFISTKPISLEMQQS